MPELAPPVSSADHVQGPSNAALTLVEYGDFQCPSCGEAYPIVKQVQRHFGDRLRFVFRNYPLEQHPMAEPAAEAAEFAAGKGKFWQMHDALYENQATLSQDLIEELADKLHLDGKALATALDDGQYAQKVEAEVQSGDRSGVEGTPTFYINGARHDGDFSSHALIAALESAS